MKFRRRAALERRNTMFENTIDFTLVIDEADIVMARQCCGFEAQKIMQRLQEWDIRGVIIESLADHLQNIIRDLDL